jgi:hypothetical protein
MTNTTDEAVLAAQDEAVLPSRESNEVIPTEVIERILDDIRSEERKRKKPRPRLPSVDWLESCLKR